MRQYRSATCGKLDWVSLHMHSVTQSCTGFPKREHLETDEIRGGIYTGPIPFNFNRNSVKTLKVH